MGLQKKSAKLTLDNDLMFAILKKFFYILFHRPGRLLKKDFRYRVVFILKSILPRSKLERGKKSRLYFDVTTIAQYDNKTGVQRVIRSFYNELQKLIASSSKYELVPVSCTAFTRGYQALIILDEFGNFKHTHKDIEPITGDIFFSLDQALIEQIQHAVDLKKFSENGCRVILTVYDLLPIQLPDCFPPEVSGIFANWLKNMAEFSEFLCDSETVASETRQYLYKNFSQIKPLNIAWFYPGANFLSNISTTGITDSQETYIRKTKCFDFNFIVVGTIEPRKGHQVVLNAFKQIWSDGKKVSLCFIGKKGWMVDSLMTEIQEQSQVNNNFFYFSDASDFFLEKAYSCSDVVIIASKNEGFGLPVIEAAFRRKRIIANDIPIFREVAPEGTYFIDFSNDDTSYRGLSHFLKKPSSPCQMNILTWESSVKLALDKLNINLYS